MKNLKIVRLCAVIGAACLALVGCASGADDSPGAKGASNGGTSSSYERIQFDKKEPLRIGYSVYDLQNPYWQSYSAGVQAAAKEKGVEAVIVDQKSDQSAQVSGSLDLVNQGVSALVITPVQPDALPASIDAAHAAKIPVIVADIGAVGDYDAYLLSNNYEGGVVAAKYLMEQLASVEGKHKVGVIELHPGSVVGEQRVAGFKETLAGNDAFEVVASLDGNDTVDGGFSAAQDMLSANPDLAAIYAANDDSAIGAQRALETAKKSTANGFVLIGFDGSKGALDLIQKGLMTATIAQDPYGQGRKAVEIALDFLAGKSPAYDDEAQRTIYFPVELVDSKNIAQFQASRAEQK
ncbi:substrate-binding domain-containing protein [Trueperella sp. LYQ143]|uniref:substrate-binding domain-containing protein n=1 Tax=Trueperella sp. LYQ143 TaxID=3391059 RepID=UPI0039831066